MEIRLSQGVKSEWIWRLIEAGATVKIGSCDTLEQAAKQAGAAWEKREKETPPCK